MTPKYLAFEIEAIFPNLVRGEYEVTSAQTGTYNCIAHAAANDTHWWWPLGSGAFWPIELREETLEAFALAYESLGYVRCGNDISVEAGVERVAIYVDADGKPTHAARQLADGSWTSKLGALEDIRHATLEAVSDEEGVGLGYGNVALVLKRAID